MTVYPKALAELETLIDKRAADFAAGRAPNDWCELPEEWLFYNGSSTPCDSAVGPCSCGAWHDKTDTLERAKSVWGEGPMIAAGVNPYK